MMAGQITEAKINQVREQTDIVELISQYVSLKRSGTNNMGLCPFHSEKSPSFSVNAAKQFYHCFGCGVGGDVFSFLMQTEGLTFPDAVRSLAERLGIELEEQVVSPEEERRQRQRERLYQVNEAAVDYFHQLLMEHPAGEVARKYMKARGYGRKAATEYQIGFALDSWDGLKNYLEEKGLAAEDARTLGLIRPGKSGRNDYDLFRGRLIFPVYDLTGRVVAFAGRVLDDGKPKYINSPESPIYHKGSILFGLYQARQAMRQSGEVLLVEGYFDQLALYRAGFPQVVATCGTALTVAHAKLLKRYIQRVVLLFDQDAAGKKATFKAMTVLQAEGVPAAVIELPAGEDPDSFIQGEGAQAFQQRLENARGAMDLFIDDLLAEAGNGIEQKAKAVEQIVAQICGLSSGLEQDLYLQQLAQRSGIDLERLQQVHKKIVGQQQQQQQRQQQRQSVPVRQPYDVEPPLPEPDAAEPYIDCHPETEQPVVAKTNWSRSEEMLLCLLLQSHISSEQLLQSGGLELFNHRDAREIAQLLLDNGSTDGIDKESLFAGVEPVKVRALAALAALDQGQLGEDAEALFGGCLKALKREQNKRQRNQLHEKIRLSEQAGDQSQVDDQEKSRLLEQFTISKKQEL
ncbi:MAG: DNA primase [Desulfuromonadales bacterium]|nr:DNA primase [Desulfuromonadales bacterium]